MSWHKETLVHSGTGYKKEVYGGFSWTAFLFSPLWLFIKGLWGHGLMYLAALIVAGLVFPPGALLVSPLYALVAGFKGNEWHYENLIKKGYKTKTKFNSSKKL